MHNFVKQDNGIAKMVEKSMIWESDLYTAVISLGQNLLATMILF